MNKETPGGCTAGFWPDRPGGIEYAPTSGSGKWNAEFTPCFTEGLAILHSGFQIDLAMSFL
jgi:hypothetical protein